MQQASHIKSVAGERRADQQGTLVSRRSDSLWQKGLLACVAAVAAIVSLVAAGTEIFIRNVVDRQLIFDQHVALFFDSKRKGVRNVVLGDSVAEVGFILEDEDFVNLSLGAEPLPVRVLKTRKYFEAIDPGLVVLAADAQALVWRDTHYSKYDLESLFSWNRRSPLRLLETHHRNLLMDYVRKYFNEGTLAENFRMLPNGGTVMINADQRLIDRRMKDGPAKARRFVPTEQRRRDYEAHYLRLLQFLNEKQAQVCLVHYPMAPIFRAEADKFPEYAEIRVWFDKAAERFGFRFLDYWDAYDDPTLYTDSMHLSETAARALTRVILNDCFGLEKEGLPRTPVSIDDGGHSGTPEGAQS